MTKHCCLIFYVWIIVALPVSHAQRFQSIIRAARITAACEKTCVLPDSLEQVTEIYLLCPEHSQYIIIPARFRQEQVQYVVKPAHYNGTTFDTIQEQVQLSPESMEAVAIPPTFQEITETVMVSPESNYRAAVYRQITRKVFRTTATPQTNIIPAVYGSITRYAIRIPAPQTGTLIPADSSSYQRQVLLTPATFREEGVPAIYGRLVRHVLVRQGLEVSLKCVCEQTLAINQVAILRKAMNDKGYRLNMAVTTLDTAFQQGLKQLQHDNQFAIGGITEQTLQFLGLL
jgi:hypothetical protein